MSDTSRAEDAAPKPERDPPGHDLMVALFDRWRAHKMKLAAKTKAARKYDGSPNTLIYRIGRTLIGCCAELLTIVFGIVFIWFNLLFFFLQSETVDLSPMKGTAQSVLTDRFNGQSADVKSLQLKWYQEEQALGFVINDLVIFDKNNVPITTAKVMDAKFDLRSLIFGSPVMSEATLEGGSLTVIRNADGVVTVGLGTPENAEAYSRELSAVQNAAENAPSGKTRKWRSISAMQLRGGQIFVIDAVEKVNWRLDAVNLDYVSNLDLIKLDLTSDIASNGQITPLNIQAMANPELSEFDIKLNTAEFYPAKLLPSTGRFSGIGALDAPVELVADIKATQSGLTLVDIDFLAGEGRIKAGKVWRDFKAAKFKANYDVSSETLRVSNLKINSDLLSLSGDVALRNFGRPEDGFFKQPVSFDVNFTPVRAELGQRFLEDLNLTSVAATGRYDLQDSRLVFTKLNTDFGGYAGEFAANIGFGSDGKLLKNIAIDGHLSGDITPQTVLNYWPNDFALGARDWISRSLLSGDIPRIDLDVSIQEDNLESGILDNEDLRISFNYFNSDVKYISTMTPLTGASGSALLEGNRFELMADQGRVGQEVNVKSARVEIPQLNPKGGDLNIEVVGEGPVAGLMSLIDEKPFEFATKANIDPRGFSGFGEVSVNVTRPLLVDFDPALIKYSATGTFTKASAPIEIGNYTLTDGEISLVVDNEQMQIEGPVSIGPWQANLYYLDLFDGGAEPSRYTVTGRLTRDDLDRFGVGQRAFFDGAADISINATGNGLSIDSANVKADLTPSSLSMGDVWRKDIGSASTLTAQLNVTDTAVTLSGVQMSAQGLSLSGDVVLAKDLRLVSADMTNVQIDRFVDATVQAGRTANNGLSVELDAVLLDVSPWMREIMKFDSDNTMIPLTLNASIQTLTLGQDLVVTGAVSSYRGDENGLSAWTLLGDLNGRAMSAEITTPIAGGRRTLDLSLPDAGRAFQTLYNFRSLDDGLLTVAATLPPAGELGGIAGTAKLEDFALVNAPIFAQILSLASLQGLADALDGGGMNFKEFEAPFTYEQGILSVKEARMGGSAIGLTANGAVDFSDQSLAVNGVLVPSYTLNSLLGDIPLLGDIIVGKKGEGIFALNYTVEGPFDKTQIAVNPLSAFTPGFLRRIFDPVPKDTPPKKTVPQAETVESEEP